MTHLLRATERVAIITYKASRVVGTIALVLALMGIATYGGAMLFLKFPLIGISLLCSLPFMGAIAYFTYTSKQGLW